MDVRCDRCETEYELDDAIVTDAGASVQCTTCGHTFTVTRRSSSPQIRVGVTPAAGLAEAVGPDVPEWTLSTEDGRIHRFRDLNTLQKWIVERKVTRNEKISRAGGAWSALGDVLELAPFFSVVDEADRARAGAPHPTSPGRAVSSSRPVQGASPSPAKPFDRSQPVSDDGPTVPNRRLPGMAYPPQSATRPDEARAGAPGSGVRSSTIPAPGLRTPGRGPPDARAPAGSNSAQGSGPVRTLSETGTGRPMARAQTGAAPVTEETRALEADFLHRSHGGRNVLLGVIALGVVGGGGYWWWTAQREHAESAQIASRGSIPGTAGPAPQPVVAARPTGPSGNAAGPAAAAGPGPEMGTPAGASDKSAVPGGHPLISPSTIGVGTTAASSGGPGVPVGGTRDATPAREAGRGVAPTDAPSARAGAGGSYARLVADADRLLERGKSAKADKLYAQALAARPDGVEALTGSAYVLLDRQRHFKAIETFRRALAIQPGFGPALFGIAESYRARGDMAQALGAYRQYLATAPSGTDAPAARRQIKDLESASPSERSAQESSPPSGEDQ